MFNKERSFKKLPALLDIAAHAQPLDESSGKSFCRWVHLAVGGRLWKKTLWIRLVCNGLLLEVIFAASPTPAQVFSTQQQALERAFPKPQAIERLTVFLDDKQVESIQKLARAKLESKIVTYYRGKENNRVTGFAFFATDVVRTKSATYMAVINPDSTVRFVEILAFYEPLDYFPVPRWLDLFRRKPLNDDLWPRRGIHNITGATLTTQALTQGVRRMLAIFRVAVPKNDHVVK